MAVWFDDSGNVRLVVSVAAGSERSSLMTFSIDNPSSMPKLAALTT
jgi:hypothetical protein